MDTPKHSFHRSLHSPLESFTHAVMARTTSYKYKQVIPFIESFSSHRNHQWFHQWFHQRDVSQVTHLHRRQLEPGYKIRLIPWVPVVINLPSTSPVTLWKDMRLMGCWCNLFLSVWKWVMLLQTYYSFFLQEIHDFMMFILKDYDLKLWCWRWQSPYRGKTNIETKYQHWHDLTALPLVNLATGLEKRKIGVHWMSNKGTVAIIIPYCCVNFSGS